MPRTRSSSGLSMAMIGWWEATSRSRSRMLSTVLLPGWPAGNLVPGEGAGKPPRARRRRGGAGRAGDQAADPAWPVDAAATAGTGCSAAGALGGTASGVGGSQGLSSLSPSRETSMP